MYAIKIIMKNLVVPKKYFRIKYIATPPKTEAMIRLRKFWPDISMSERKSSPVLPATN